MPFPKSGIVAQIVSSSDLIKNLECPICAQVPYPPIYGCYNGHIVCNSCRRHMKHCGICRQPFWEGRNAVVENIINLSKFYCNYKDIGCTEILLGSEIKNHIKRCMFGPSSQESEPGEPGEKPPGSFKWVHCSNGQLPENAVDGGRDENGDKLYVARALHCGGLIPGKFSVSTGKAYVSMDCLEHEKNEYEILVAEPDSLTWKHGYSGYVPPLAVPCGPAETGEMLYIGRWGFSGNMIIGKIHSSHGCCYIPFQGAELARQHYEVLTRRVNIDFEVSLELELEVSQVSQETEEVIQNGSSESSESVSSNPQQSSYNENSYFENFD